jgi:dethiobiotin synthetase
MPRSWFVTGTDTEVGKTAVSAGLLLAARARGLSTAAVKPVAAGCDEQGHNEDAQLLQSVMTAELDYQQVNPVAFQPAIAPHIAAAMAGKNPTASQLAGYCRAVTMGAHDFVLIEGAGGWRVPLNRRETLADLAVALQTPVILVVAMRLGCINHALLSAEAILGDGLPLAGWVANCVGPEMDSHADNVQSLRERLPAPLLGEVPFLSPLDLDQLASHLDISELLR